MAECRSCGAPIEWVVMPSGKKMPLDPGPHPNGNVEVIGTEGRVVPKSVAEDRGRANLRMPHWKTCPNAKEHRR